MNSCVVYEDSLPVPATYIYIYIYICIYIYIYMYIYIYICVCVSRDSSPEKPPSTPPHQFMLSDVTSPKLTISPVEDSSQSEQLDNDDLINMLQDVIRETMTSLNV